MRKAILFFLFLAVFIFPAIRTSAGVLGGPSADDIAQANQKTATNFLNTESPKWLTKFVGGAGNAAVNALFIVYGWLGEVLIPIPDLASKSTFGGLTDANSNQLTARGVQDVIYIMLWIGIITLFVSFSIHVGSMALDITKHNLNYLIVLRLLIPLMCLFAWPSIVSFCGRFVTDLGYYIYHQNTLETKGVFEGLQNFAITNGPISPNGSYDNSNQYIVQQGFNSIMDLTWGFAGFFCLIGMVYGFFHMRQGVEYGGKIVAGAAVCLLLVGFSPLLITLLTKQAGVEKIGATSPWADKQGQPIFSTRGVLPNTTNGQFNLPGEKNVESQVVLQSPPAAPPPTDTDPNAPNPVMAEYNWSQIVSGILKIFISVFGILIVIGVLIAKMYQVVSIFVLLFLGFVFIGLLGHPSSQNICLSGLKLFLKLHLYTPIWALTLLILHWVVHIKFTSNLAGISGILTVFAVLAALQVIQNTSDFAGIFSNFNWKTGDTGQRIFSDTVKAAQTTALAAGVATSAPTQKLAGLATGGAGALIGMFGGPGGAAKGFALGQKLGAGSMKSMNVISNTVSKKGAGINQYSSQISQAANKAGAFIKDKAFSGIKSPNPYNAPGSKASGGRK